MGVKEILDRLMGKKKESVEQPYPLTDEEKLSIAHSSIELIFLNGYTYRLPLIHYSEKTKYSSELALLMKWALRDNIQYLVDNQEVSSYDLAYQLFANITLHHDESMFEPIKKQFLESSEYKTIKEMLSIRIPDETVKAEEPT